MTGMNEVPPLRRYSAAARQRGGSAGQSEVRAPDDRRPTGNQMRLRQRAGTAGSVGAARALSAARLCEIIGTHAFRRLIRLAPGVVFRVPTIDPRTRTERNRGILAAIDEGATYDAVAREFGVHRATVIRIAVPQKRNPLHMATTR